MIFAAGLGTRLRPLTDTLPKALIPVAGVPMLQRVAARLIGAGATRLIVNVHHHAGMIADVIEECHGFGVETIISDESDLLLDTGGGLRHAARFFRNDASFLLHNSDIISDIDLARLYRAQCEREPLATLAVMERETSRYLAFDETGELCGYGNSATGFQEMARQPVGGLRRLGFCGVHAVSPRIFGNITEEGAFSIIPLYMRLLREGESILAHRVDGALWIDIGKPEQLSRAESLLGRVGCGA
ncbi:MAG: Nucleotidyl transferase [Chlorobi bacterium]|nr:Nucleotidyl transferase [Chlorobiota bacterium]